MGKRDITTIGWEDRWSDIDHKFITDPEGNIKIAVDIEAVFTSIDNIIFTMVGERPMHRDFGSSIYHSLFKRITSESAELVADAIKEDIETWDDRVSVIQADFINDNTRRLVSLQLKLVIRGYDSPVIYVSNI